MGFFYLNENVTFCLVVKYVYGTKTENAAAHDAVSFVPSAT